MATFKMFSTFAMIIGCFAIIYPKFLHPLLLRCLGLNAPPQKENKPDLPLHMHNKKQGSANKELKNVHHHVRPGPHPGMRASVEMQKQHTSGRGMMEIMLPMYAVFSKTRKCSTPYKNKSFDEGRVLDRMGFPQDMGSDECNGSSDLRRYLDQKRREHDFEDMLVRMDNGKTVSDYEMQALQKRLEETEAHMTHILEAMHSLQQQASVEPTLESQDVTGKMAAVPASDAEPTFRPGKHDSAIWSHMPRSDLYAVPKLDSKTEECADTSAGHLVQMEEDHGTEHMTDLEKDQSFKATIKLTSKPVICGESDSCSFVYRCRGAHDGYTHLTCPEGSLHGLCKGTVQEVSTANDGVTDFSLHDCCGDGGKNVDSAGDCYAAGDQKECIKLMMQSGGHDTELEQPGKGMQVEPSS